MTATMLHSFGHPGAVFCCYCGVRLSCRNECDPCPGDSPEAGDLIERLRQTNERLRFGNIKLRQTADDLADAADEMVSTYPPHRGPASSALSLSVTAYRAARLREWVQRKAAEEDNGIISVGVGE